MKRILIALLLLGKLATGYAQIIEGLEVSFVAGGINVMVNSYGYGTHFISDSYQVNNHQIDLGVCFWSDNTTVTNTFNNEIFIPLTVNGEYVITAKGYTSTAQTICDYSNLWSELTTTLNYLSAPDFEKDNLSIFPNPTNGMIQLSHHPMSLKEVHVFDQLGRLVTHLDEFPNLKIDLQNLNDGIYLVAFQTNNGTFIKKVVIKK